MTHELPGTLVELRRQIVAKRWSVRDALAHQWQRLEGGKEHWNSIVTVFDAPATLPDANAPLAGIGVAHKDIFVVGGRLPQCGAHPQTPIRLAKVPSPPVKRLGSLGATTLAMTAMAEFASGITAENPNIEPLRNPLYPNAMVGGSSSGSGVAVAAGLAYGSLGTDTAGSVRVPAATCGILGLKPTHALLSTSGCHPLAPSLDSVGVLARSARDALQLLAGSLPYGKRRQILGDVKLVSSELPLAGWYRDLDQDLQLPASLRAACCFQHPNGQYSADTRQQALIDDYLAGLDRHLSQRRDVSIRELPDLMQQASIVMHAEAAATHYEALRNAEPLSALTRATALPGAALPAAWYAMAFHHRTAARQLFIQRYLKDNDLLITPALPQGVPDASQVDTSSPAFQPKLLLGLFAWMSFVNYLGLPAIVFPVGHDRSGRPVSIQAIARPNNERLLLALAHHAETTRFGNKGFIAFPPALQTNPSY